MKDQYSKVNELKGLINNIDAAKMKDTGSILISTEIANAVANTELTDTQIRKVVQLTMLYKYTGNKLIKAMVLEFLNAQKSRLRQSRREYVENNQSLKSHIENKGIVRGLGDYLKEQV